MGAAASGSAAQDASPLGDSDSAKQCPSRTDPAFNNRFSFELLCPGLPSRLDRRTPVAAAGAPSCARPASGQGAAPPPPAARIQLGPAARRRRAFAPGACILATARARAWIRPAPMLSRARVWIRAMGGALHPQAVWATRPAPAGARAGPARGQRRGPAGRPSGRGRGTGGAAPRPDRRGSTPTRGRPRDCSEASEIALEIAFGTARSRSPWRSPSSGPGSAGPAGSRSRNRRPWPVAATAAPSLPGEGGADSETGRARGTQT